MLEEDKLELIGHLGAIDLVLKTLTKHLQNADLIDDQFLSKSLKHYANALSEVVETDPVEYDQKRKMHQATVRYLEDFVEHLAEGR